MQKNGTFLDAWKKTSYKKMVTTGCWSTRKKKTGNSESQLLKKSVLENPVNNYYKKVNERRWWIVKGAGQ